jgi:hypothetical protein
MTQSNCHNCGAPITGSTCEYCGTRFNIRVVEEEIVEPLGTVKLGMTMDEFATSLAAYGLMAPNEARRRVGRGIV